MKPGARLQAAITLLEKVLVTTAPADSVITQYFRQCRYMGSSDRRAISEMVYQILRHYEELAWYLPEHQVDARLLVLVYVYKFQKLTLEQLEDLCREERFHPSPLTPEEQTLLQKTESMQPDAQVRLNIPAWALPHLQDAFGEQLEDAMNALNQSAPFDLRVNTLKTSRGEVVKQLQKEGFGAEPTPWSPVGIRVGERRPLSGHTLWKDGKIEVQDEGSQLLSLLVDAKPGMTVLDFCAGAGGKTLAMAATMENKGRIVATDISTWRLNRSRERLRRAGANNVEVRSLEEDAKWLKRQAGRFDRILVDAPCSGSGTWRRNPDLKLRFSENDLAEVREKQRQILDRAASLVKEGGRLIYATCSLFREENEHQVQKFLETHPSFTLIPIQEVWSSLFETPCPVTTATLQLLPHVHHVDGFFMAVMECKGT